MKKFNSKILFILFFVLMFSPFFAFAQTSGSSGPTCDLPANPKISDLFVQVTCIIYQTLIPMFFSLAVGIFIWGIVQYVMNPADEGKREKGKTYMVWGIIGLTVMVSIWGLVTILGDTFEIDTSVVPTAPGN